MKNTPIIGSINSNYFRFAGVMWTSIITFGMTTLFLFAYVVPPVLMQPDEALTFMTALQSMNYYVLLGFGSQYVLQVIFIGAVVIHILESMVACALSIDMGCKNTYIYWTLQTLLLGYPSLRLLLLRRQSKNRK